MIFLLKLHQSGSLEHQKCLVAHEAYIASLESFIGILTSEEAVRLALASDEDFFLIMEQVRVRKLCHYTRLAQVMGLKDSSTVSRWYSAKCTPDRFRRVAAFKALTLVISNDVTRLRNMRNRIGHYSVKEFPELEVQPLL